MMTKKRIFITYFLTYLLTIIICSGKSNCFARSNQANKHHASFNQVTEEAPNKCFSMQNGYNDIVYTDTLIYVTDSGNYFMKVGLNDSTYQYSCGRGEIQQIIDTFRCSELAESFFDWETSEFIGLIENCGSYCWINTIIPVDEKNPILYLSNSEIDLESMNAAIFYNDTLEIINLKSQNKIAFSLHEVVCHKGYLLFSIEQIELSANSVEIIINCRDNTKLKVIKEFDELCE